MITSSLKTLEWVNFEDFAKEFLQDIKYVVKAVDKISVVMDGLAISLSGYIGLDTRELYNLSWNDLSCLPGSNQIRLPKCGYIIKVDLKKRLVLKEFIQQAFETIKPNQLEKKVFFYKRKGKEVPVKPSAQEVNSFNNKIRIILSCYGFTFEKYDTLWKMYGRKFHVFSIEDDPKGLRRFLFAKRYKGSNGLTDPRFFNDNAIKILKRIKTIPESYPE